VTTKTFTGMNVPMPPVPYVGPFANVAGIPCHDPYEDMPDPYEYDDPTPTACPECGDENLTHDAADPSVGIFGDAVYCEECGWPEDPNATTEETK